MPSLGRRLFLGFISIVIVVIGGGLGYYLIGRSANAGWEFGDCIYMTVITVTTVGYGEILKDMDKVEGARAFAKLTCAITSSSVASPTT